MARGALCVWLIQWQETHTFEQMYAHKNKCNFKYNVSVHTRWLKYIIHSNDGRWWRRCRGRERRICTLRPTTWPCKWPPSTTRRLIGGPKCWRPPEQCSLCKACSFSSLGKERAWRDKTWPRVYSATAWYATFDSQVNPPVCCFQFPLRLLTKLWRRLWEYILSPSTGLRGGRTTTPEREDWVGRPADSSVQRQVKSNADRWLWWGGNRGGEAVSGSAGLQDDVHPPGGTLQAWRGCHLVSCEVSCHISFISGVMRNVVV